VKLRTRLVAWYSGVFLASSAALVTAMYAVVAHKLRNDFRHYLEDEYAEACRITRDALNDWTELRRDVEVEVEGNRYFPMSYRLYDARQGSELIVVAPKWREALDYRPELGGRGGQPSRTERQLRDGATHLVHFVTGPLDDAESRHLIVEVGMSYTRVYKRLHSLREVLLFALVVGAIASVVGGWFLASRSLRPIDTVASALEHIEAESLSDRLPERKTADEIGRLTAAVNRMLSRLEQSFETNRTFTADAAHELKTPLTALKCRLEMAADAGDGGDLRQATRDCLGAVNDLSHLIDNMLLLARLDSEQRPRETEPVCLSDVWEDVREIFEALAEQQGVRLDFRPDDECRVAGDRALLRRLLSNLVENAISYTRSGGQVTVILSRGQGTCQVAVSDTGIGIDREDLDRVFERFFRADRSRARARGGTGLGLSICRRIAELHGGTISVRSERGMGSTFCITLPAVRRGA